jgi:unsaturated rhamnogalacturonyl hydrolase
MSGTRWSAAWCTVVLAVACSSKTADTADAGPPCTPVSPHPTDAYATARAPQSDLVALAKSIADRYMAVHPAASLAWSWGEGVLMGAMVDLYRVTANGAYRDYYRSWMDANIAQGYSIVSSDTCAPALAAIALREESCDPKYTQVVSDVFDYLDHRALRTNDGGISHFGALTTFGPTLWIDSLYMFGEVLVRWGDRAKDATRLDLYSTQYLVFAKDLQDAGTGWFTHAYDWIAAQDPGVFWGRGNGWIVASGADYLGVRAERGESDEAVRRSWAKLAGAVVAAQDPSTGLFWTVVNRPGATYLETSATALFAYGLARARRAGLLDATVLPVVRSAVAGLKSRIPSDPQGRPFVTGISGPTPVGQFKDYAAVPVEDDVTYGVGAVMMALLEASGLE